MVYGSTLRLPGEFFTPSLTTSLPDPSEFLNQLITHFRTTSPISPRPTQRTTHIADGLSKATHVFVHHDAVRKPLQPPYDGPFPVIKSTAKHFTDCEKSSGSKTTFFCGSTSSPVFIDAYRFVIWHFQHFSEAPQGCWIITEETGEVCCAHCNRMAGSGETCTHTAAELYYSDKCGILTHHKT